MEPVDLYPLVEGDSAQFQFDRLYENWQAEESVDQPSLMRALKKTFGKEGEEKLMSLGGIGG